MSASAPVVDLDQLTYAGTRFNGIDGSIAQSWIQLNTVTTTLGQSTIWRGSGAQKFNHYAAMLLTDLKSVNTALQKMLMALSAIQNAAMDVDAHLHAAAGSSAALQHHIEALKVQLRSATSHQMPHIESQMSALQTQLAATNAPYAAAQANLAQVLQISAGQIAEVATRAPKRHWRTANLNTKKLHNPRPPHKGGTYTPVPGTLFDGKTTARQVQQGNLGDCYLLASAAALAMVDPKLLKKRIVDRGNGIYDVTLFIRGRWRTYTVDSELLYGSGDVPRPGAFGQPVLWPAVLEKAYAEALAGYPNMDDGGYPSDALMALTGNTTGTVQFSSTGAASMGSFLRHATGAHQAVVFITNQTEPKPGNGVPYIVPDHAYFLQSYDARTGMVQLGNPWGVDNPPPLTLHQVCKYFYGAQGTAGL